MPLTLNQAKLAGSLAAQIENVQTSIGNLQAAIDGGAISTEFGATVTVNGQGHIMRGNIAMDAEATAAVFAVVIAAYEGKLASLQAQLDKLTD